MATYKGFCDSRDDSVVFGLTQFCDHAVCAVFGNLSFRNVKLPCVLGYQVPCRKFADQGALAFVLTSLASLDAGMRAAGYHVLSEYSSHLEGDQFREKAQVCPDGNALL